MEIAYEERDRIAEEMTPAQIAEARVGRVNGNRGRRTNGQTLTRNGKEY